MRRKCQSRASIEIRLQLKRNCLFFILSHFEQMILRLETMTNEREAKMNDLWQKLQLFLADYSIQSEEKFNEYVQLRERDNADTKEIKQHYSEIDQATNQIITLKEVLAAEEVDHRIHVNQLEEYKKLLQDEYNRLKEKMENSRKSDREKLKLFVVCSTKAHEVRNEACHFGQDESI